MFRFLLVVNVILILFSRKLSGFDLLCPSYPPTCDLDSSLFSNILDEIDEYIETTIMKQNNITGFITTIVYDQQILFSKGYGLRNYQNESSGAPNGDNLVMIASNTKIFTALLTYYLRDNNIYNLSLNDPITKYLPTFSVKSLYNNNNNNDDYDASNDITLIQLLSHTSGLQITTPYPYQDVSNNETAILNALSQRYLIFPGYTHFHYSNLGYSLLGRGIEKIFCPQTGGCYEYYVKKLILDGLNFSEYSGFNYSSYIIDNYCAIGWFYNESVDSRQQGPIRNDYWDNPCGAMLASPNDMAKFMMFMFNNDYNDYYYNTHNNNKNNRNTTNNNVNNDNTRLLKGNTINEMLKPKILLNDGKEAIGTPFEMHYHLFRRMYNINNNSDKNSSLTGVWFKGKQGEVLGYRSCTMMVPDYKLGVFSVALEDPDSISEGSVWTNDILDKILPYLDYLLYNNYYKNIQFYLPNNYKLLIGKYINVHDSIDIVTISVEKDVNSGKQYLLFSDNYNTSHNFLLFDENISNIFKLGNDVQNNKETCFWGGLPQTNELLYFDFANGTENHAISLVHAEMFYIFV